MKAALIFSPSSTISWTSQRQESGKLELNRAEEFDIQPITLEACVRMCRGRSEVNKVELIFFGGPNGNSRGSPMSACCCKSSPTSSTNAIKFTPEGGAVRLYVSASFQKGILLKVTDNRYRDRAGKHRTGAAPVRAGGNLLFAQAQRLGLGLPYAKRLTELHGGVLEIESELGKGTTVSVTFPSSRLVDIRKRAELRKAM